MLKIGGARVPSKRDDVRLGVRTALSLALCAAAAGAAMAHFAIDVAGDYLLANDSYDHLRHDSRELLTGLALAVAALLAARGLRICCEIACANRARLLRPVLARREAVAVLAGALLTSSAIVPAMEYLDGRLDGMPVQGLDAAFGGSILLGLLTTVLCTAFVAAVVIGLARWLISHRDAVAGIIETLLRPPAARACRNDYDLLAQRFTPRRRRAVYALTLTKRGPPATSCA